MNRTILDILTKYKNFEECVINDIQFKKHGYEVEFLINYIYNKKGVINFDIDRQTKLIFNCVQEFRITNSWNSSQISEPENINWGSSEVAIIQLSDGDSDLLNKYKSHLEENISFHHVEVLWESERRIDIIFKDLSVEEVHR